MSSFANQLSLFILIITVSSSLARESPFFTRISPAASDDFVAVNSQPEFLPGTESYHGLYGQDSTESLPTFAVDDAESKPANYNPFSYVTESEAPVRSAKPVTESKPANYNPFSYDTESEAPVRSAKPIVDSSIENYENSVYNGTQNDELTPAEKQAEYRNNHYSGGGGDLSLLSGVGPQGMSDTRSYENGKYHFNIDTEKYNGNHPYESVNAYEFNGAKNYNGGYEYNGGKNYVAGYEDPSEENFNSQH